MANCELRSGFDIPEIGVHIVQVSNASAPPQVIRRLDGYEAILPIGVATLRIARSAKLRGVEGVVDLEYGIDDKGHVRDLRGTYSASQTLQDAAQALLRSTTFQVKPNWEADDYQNLRFTAEVQFWLGRCPRNFPARTVGAEVITICDSVRPR